MTREARSASPQRFSLRLDGRTYVVETSGRLTTRLVLRRDGEELARGSVSGEHGRVATPGGGVKVEIRRTSLGRVRRATLKLHSRELDLDPEPGSPAARRLERERARPVAYGVLDVVVAALGLLVPLLGLGALAKLLLEPVLRWLEERLPRVDLPSIPLPDVDLPRIPWPHVDLSWLPDLDPPPWVVWVLDNVGELTPVLVAAVLAWHEVRRRRRQDALKSELAARERQELLTRLARAMDAASRAPLDGSSQGRRAGDGST